MSGSDKFPEGASTETARPAVAFCAGRSMRCMAWLAVAVACPDRTSRWATGGELVCGPVETWPRTTPPLSRLA